MSNEIVYKSQNIPSVALTTAESTTPKIDVREFSLGMIHLPSTSTAVTVTYYSSPTENGTYSIVYTNSAATTVAATQTIPAAALSQQIPAAALVAGWLKITLNAAATVNLSFK